eukprot:12917028-Prorocentrum_lima.AAC.1
MHLYREGGTSSSSFSREGLSGGSRGCGGADSDAGFRIFGACGTRVSIHLGGRPGAKLPEGGSGPLGARP